MAIESVIGWINFFENSNSFSTDLIKTVRMDTKLIGLQDVEFYGKPDLKGILEKDLNRLAGRFLVTGL